MPRTTRAAAMPLVVCAAASLAAVELALFSVGPEVSVLPAFWPASGVLVAALLLAEYPRWLPLVLVSVVPVGLSLAGLHDRPFGVSLAMAVVMGIDAVAIAWCVRRLIEVDFGLDYLTHTVALAAVSAIVPALGGSLLAALISDGGPALPLLRGWSFAETAGVLTTAPFVVSVILHWRGFGRAARSARGIEIGFTLLVGIFMFERIISGSLGPLAVPAYLLPFLLWPALRFGPGPSSAAVLAMAMIALHYASQGTGLIAQVGTSAIVPRTQGGIAVAAVSLLLLSSVVAERKRVAHERDVLVGELKRALGEIKTLQGFIPICAWCHKVRDDAGFWQGIESYLDHHTEATFSHSICPSCTALEHEEIAAHEDAGRYA